MNVMKHMEAYFQLSDVMYQALKARKYEIFESALYDREAIVAHLKTPEAKERFRDISFADKQELSSRITQFETDIENEMKLFLAELKEEQATIQQSKSKLRTKSKVTGYLKRNPQSNGIFIDKRK